MFDSSRSETPLKRKLSPHSGLRFFGTDLVRCGGRCPNCRRTYGSEVASLLRSCRSAAGRFAAERIRTCSVPRSLSNLCKRGLSKRPSERWGPAAELREAIQGWLEGRAPVVCPGTLLQRILAQGIKAIDRFPVLLPLLAVIGLAVFVSLQITLLWRALR